MTRGSGSRFSAAIVKLATLSAVGLASVVPALAATGVGISPTTPPAGPAAFAAASTYSFAVDGSALTGPTLSNASGAGTFYPVRDGYRDTFAARVTLGAPGRLALVITDRRGHVVRTVAVTRPAGPTTIIWNGRSARGHLVAAGRYHWHVVLTDEAGNSSRTPTRVIVVSHERLVHTTAVLRENGAASTVALGTDPSCTSAKRRGSRYAHGRLLINGCNPDTGDLAFASYHFTLPREIAYGRLTLVVDGASTHRPSALTAALQRDDGELEIPNYVTVSLPGTRWVRIVRAPTAGLLGAGRHISLSVVLDSTYPGRNDFDLRYVELRVVVMRLQ